MTFRKLSIGFKDGQPTVFPLIRAAEEKLRDSDASLELAEKRKRYVLRNLYAREASWRNSTNTSRKSKTCVVFLAPARSNPRQVDLILTVEAAG